MEKKNCKHIFCLFNKHDPQSVIIYYNNTVVISQTCKVCKKELRKSFYKIER